MFRYLYPNLYKSSIFQIPYKNLKSKKIINLLFDVDNTLVPINWAEPGDDVCRLFTKLKGMGFGLCILSNGGSKRVTRIAESLSIPFVAHAKKPLSSGLAKALSILSASASNTAIIGDQIFTDVLLGKKTGMYAVLVKPVSDLDEWFIRPKRFVEKLILREYTLRHE